MSYLRNSEGFTLVLPAGVLPLHPAGATGPRPLVQISLIPYGIDEIWVGRSRELSSLVKSRGKASGGVWGRAPRIRRYDTHPAVGSIRQSWRIYSFRLPDIVPPELRLYSSGGDYHAYTIYYHHTVFHLCSLGLLWREKRSERSQRQAGCRSVRRSTAFERACVHG